jgi:hypothetical protein
METVRRKLSRQAAMASRIGVDSIFAQAFARDAENRRNSGKTSPQAGP